MKIKWEIQSKATGPYASFQKRGWPTGYFADGPLKDRPAISISCPDNYSLTAAKSGKHSPLTVFVADYSGPGAFVWRKLTEKYKSLIFAKAAGIDGLKAMQ